jgi:glycosyltransferase involved in cell wall biosynthesis
MKFLFASSHCLIDKTSGAAISVSTLLGGLLNLGHEVLVMGATVYDSEDAARRGPPPPSGMNFFSVNWHGIEHRLSATKYWVRDLVSAIEEEAFEFHFIKLIEEYQPDVLITYGGFLLERSILRESRAHGIRNVFYLANPNYHHSRSFQDVDVMVTDSHSTAKLYQERLQVTLHPVGKFIDKRLVVAMHRDPSFITFVNPSLEKGVSMVAQLALMCRKALPQARFLVVESRGKWETSLKILGLSPDDFPNVVVYPPQSDMRQVFSKTRVLLAPSFWHESGSRLVIESLLNGIPVLAASHGGLSELIGGAGFLIDIPVDSRLNPEKLVTEKVALPWFNVLKSLMVDSDAYENAAFLATKAAQQYDLEKQVLKFLEIILNKN